MRQLGELLKPHEDVLDVTAVSYDYDCGDKRSYGRLSVTATVEGVGEVKLQDFAVGSGGGLEPGWSEKVLVNNEETSFENCPSVEVPHYYAGVRTCQRWEERADETLTEDILAWLVEELGEWEDAAS